MAERFKVEHRRTNAGAATFLCRIEHVPTGTIAAAEGYCSYSVAEDGWRRMAELLDQRLAQFSSPSAQEPTDGDQKEDGQEKS